MAVQISQQKFFEQITYGQTGTTGAEFEMYLYLTPELKGEYESFIRQNVTDHDLQRYYLGLPDGPVPVSHLLLDLLKANDSTGQWTYEFTGTQIEYRTFVHSEKGHFIDDVLSMITFIKEEAQKHGLEIRFIPVGPEDISMDIYPHNERYQKIQERFQETPEILRAAYRVAGLHFHFGVSNWEEMKAVYNEFVDELDSLKQLGDPTGERLAVYQIVAEGAEQDLQPPRIESQEDFYQTAVDQGFAENLKDCWWYVRMTPYGTVEIRVFNTTDDPDQISAIYDRCCEIAQRALQKLYNQN